METSETFRRLHSGSGFRAQTKYQLPQGLGLGLRSWLLKTWGSGFTVLVSGLRVVIGQRIGFSVLGLIEFI